MLKSLKKGIFALKKRLSHGAIRQKTVAADNNACLLPKQHRIIYFKEMTIFFLHFSHFFPFKYNVFFLFAFCSTKARIFYEFFLTREQFKNFDVKLLEEVLQVFRGSRCGGGGGGGLVL